MLLTYITIIHIEWIHKGARRWCDVAESVLIKAFIESCSLMFAPYTDHSYLFPLHNLERKKNYARWKICLVIDLLIPTDRRSAIPLRIRSIFKVLIHWGRNKMAAMWQTTHSNAFSLMKMLQFLFQFYWSMFLRVQLTIFQHWFG